jgi:hypothetical protein
MAVEIALLQRRHFHLQDVQRVVVALLDVAVDQAAVEGADGDLSSAAPVNRIFLHGRCATAAQNSSPFICGIE